MKHLPQYRFFLITLSLLSGCMIPSTSKNNTYHYQFDSTLQQFSWAQCYPLNSRTLRYQSRTYALKKLTDVKLTQLQPDLPETAPQWAHYAIGSGDTRLLLATDAEGLVNRSQFIWRVSPSQFATLGFSPAATDCSQWPNSLGTALP